MSWNNFVPFSISIPPSPAHHCHIIIIVHSFVRSFILICYIEPFTPRSVDFSFFFLSTKLSESRRGSRSSLSEINALKSFCVLSFSLFAIYCLLHFPPFLSILSYYFLFLAWIFCINAVSFFLAWLDWFIQCDQNIVWVLCVCVCVCRSVCVGKSFLFASSKSSVHCYHHKIECSRTRIMMICTRRHLYLQSKAM